MEGLLFLIVLIGSLFIAILIGVVYSLIKPEKKMAVEQPPKCQPISSETEDKKDSVHNATHIAYRFKDDDDRRIINGEHIPNILGTAEEAHTGAVSYYKYSEEDWKIMNNLSTPEALEYSAKLIAEGKCVRISKR